VGRGGISPLEVPDALPSDLGSALLIF
jgi:hypothetical protein